MDTSESRSDSTLSARNRRPEKKIRKLRRSLRQGRVPAYIDLVQWLRDRGYAQTAGAARRLIVEGRVVSESHVLGKTMVEVDGAQLEMFTPHVPARLRDSLEVTDA